MPQPTMGAKQIIEQVFNDIALPYDRTGPSIYTQFGARLVEKMPLTAGASMLDIATGKGAVLLPAARRVGSAGTRHWD